ncbi:hypothetical protein GGR20_000126 [Devosia subaequoris]|uniref:Uncharacterized protein n=1 Tax=Devosia subaequoris TaxID=395930 RepID=A0A7W6IIY7_9HYPH|nr:hypothetical protein [Devosia subaequoris]MBB4050508.1 hypothetical protein [Devosia subaequoris]MCP1208808.1 hypothetical protein [Devosia subaequoris]
MKLTWFGNSTFRIYIGGQIAIIDVDGAPDGVESSELTSGADLLIPDFGRGLLEIEPSGWTPRKPPRLVDTLDGQERRVEVHRASQGCIVFDAPDEAPLILLRDGDAPPFGRWTEQAVIVLVGPQLRERAERLAEETRPKLVALAGGVGEIDAAFDYLGNRLSGTGLIALEPGLAVEA